MFLYTSITVLGAVLICKGSYSRCNVTPKDVFSIIGSTVNLTCNSEVDRMYVTWLGPPNLTVYAIGNMTKDIKGAAIQIVGNEKERHTILQILNMQANNEGFYKCTCIKCESCFQVFTQKPPSNISIERSNTERIVFGTVNHQVNLTCNVETGKPPEAMSWEYEHEIVATGGPRSLTYSFISESKHHLQIFMCIAINNVTKTKLTETVVLYLYYEPTVKICPGGVVNITEEESVSLECNYTSNDKRNTSITWKNTSKGKAVQISNKLFKLESINRTDAGQYTCLVSNSAGKAEDTMTVNVLYPPAVYITLEDPPSDRIFKCNAHGNPDVYVFSAWEHITEYGDHIRFLNDNGRGCIKLEHSSKETDRHHDQGIYTCSVSNGVLYHGKNNWSANYSLKTEGIPYFATSNKIIQYGILGKENNLTLNVVSYPIIKTVSVYRNQSVIMTDVKVPKEFSKIGDIMYGTKVNIKGYILFVPIQTGAPEDFMTYTVSVSNVHGQTHMSVDFKSASVPMKPTQVKAITGVHTIKLTWERGFDGGFVQSFEIEYRKIGSGVLNVEKGYSLNHAIINGLESETYFRLRVYSRNVIGRSNSSDEIVVQTGKQHEVSSSYTAMYVTIPMLIILIIACGILIYYHFKKGTFIRNVDLSCFQWTYRRNAVGGQGVENGMYDMQNNAAAIPGAQSSDPPVYSSIDRKHNLSIGQTVSYSVAKKKKPNPLGARNRNKGKQHDEKETDIEMSTIETGENLQLNYVDVCFDPKPVGHQFKIHGIDKKSEYVDIDFSKSINILPDSEKLDGSDEDFSSVEDVIAMKRDMMIS